MCQHSWNEIHLMWKCQKKVDWIDSFSSWLALSVECTQICVEFKPFKGVHNGEFDVLRTLCSFSILNLFECHSLIYAHECRQCTHCFLVYFAFELNWNEVKRVNEMTTKKHNSGTPTEHRANNVTKACCLTTNVMYTSLFLILEIAHYF